MRNEEWDTIEMVLEECWPGKWGENTGDAYRIMLGDFTADALLAGIRKVAAEPRNFDMRPSAGKILAAVTDVPSGLTWPEVFDALYGPGRVLKGRTDAECVERAAVIHPVLGSWVAMAGPTRLKQLQLWDPDWGEKRRADLAREWGEFQGVREERVRHGLALDMSPRRGELGPMDPLAVLGVDAPRRGLEAGS